MSHQEQHRFTPRVERALLLSAQGWKLAEIARETGLSRWHVSRARCTPAGRARMAEIFDRMADAAMRDVFD